MSEESQTTPLIAPPPHSDLEKSSPASQKKTFIRSVFSWCAGLPRKHPFFSAVALCIALAGVIAGVAYQSFNLDMRFAYQQIPYDQSGIALIGHSYQLDTTNQTLSVRWEIAGCGEYRLPTYPSWAGLYGIPGCDACNRAVDIYFNGASEPTSSYDPATLPLDSGNETTYLYNLNEFIVVHPISVFAQDVAPFDTYALTATVFVIEKATNSSAPIIAFAVGEGSNNFVVSSNSRPTRSSYTYNPGTGPATVEVQSSAMYITVRRSQLAQAFTVCLLLINLALTAGSVYVTILVLTRRERINEGIILFPVTVVLTIPALRNLYPGSPPFGIYIDTFGLFSQMMIVALCSMILLYLVAKPSTPDRRASRVSKNT